MTPIARKPRVFIAYHHRGNQNALNRFRTDYCDDAAVFTDRSIQRAANSTEVSYLTRVCREAIDGTSVTLVMLGRWTGHRKFVDWEIHYTLAKQHGLVAISRPGLDDARASLPDRLLDNLTSGYAQWYDYPQSARELWSMLAEARSADKRLIDNTRPRMTRNRPTPKPRRRALNRRSPWTR